MAAAHQHWTVLPHRPIEHVADNLWRVEGDMTNMPLKRVMTLARLSDGGLVIHNAIALDDDAMRAIEAWGDPAFLVVPNGWHRLDAKVFTARYPAIKVLCPRGARAKVEQVVPVDLTYEQFEATETVSFDYPEGVRNSEGVMRVVSGDGHTLVFNDLIFNQPHFAGLQGLVFRLMGSTGGARVTRVSRMFMVRDKPALRAYLERLAAEPGLRRVIVSHGTPVYDDAAGMLRGVAASF